MGKPALLESLEMATPWVQTPRTGAVGESGFKSWTCLKGLYDIDEMQSLRPHFCRNEANVTWFTSLMWRDATH